MRIKTDKDKFLTFLRRSGLYSGGGIEDIPIILKPDVALVDVRYTNSVGTYGRYLPQYFNSYEVDEETEISITGEVYDYLRDFRSDTLDIRVEDTKITVSGKRVEEERTYSEDFESKVTDLDKQRTGYDMSIVEEMIVPGEFSADLQAKIPVTELSDMKTAEAYDFTWEGNRLVLTTGDEIHSYTDELVLSEVMESGEFKIRLNGKLMRKVANNLVGEVLVLMNSDGAVFASGGEYWRETYLMTGMIEEW